MINGIHHPAIVTHDLDRLVRFYCELLGFEPAGEGAWADSATMDAILGIPGSAGRIAMLRTGNSYLELFEFEAPAVTTAADPSANAPGYSHICLDVTDIDHEYRRLMEAGMTFKCPLPAEAIAGVRSVYGHDPDGNIIELTEVQQVTGGVSLSQLRLMSGS